jgi:hypothetical protein
MSRAFDDRPRRILFSGYAPVHFLCFLPIYQRLAADPRLELWLSGGFKREEGGNVTFSVDGFYDAFPVDHGRVISSERAREEDFDVLVCAHLSDALFPRSARRTVQIFHGVSFKNLAVREKALRFDFLCLPGRYHAELYRRSGLVRPSGARCLVTGFPKADALVNGADDRQTLLEGLRLDPSLPTLLFAPTGDKHNALETLGAELLQAVQADGRFNLLIKPHDHPKHKLDWLELLAPLEGGVIRLVRDLDVVPYLRAADVLLTDASSVAVEYTLLDRPIVFLDVPKLFKQVKKRAPNLDLDTYGRRIGRVAATGSEIIGAIEAALAEPDRESEIRRAMARHIFHEPGHATERVASVVLHAAGLVLELPSEIEELAPEPASVPHLPTVGAP